MKKETYRINATRRAFVFEKKLSRKGEPSWDAVAWFTSPEQLVRHAIDLKARSLINANGKNVADAIREATATVKAILEPGKPIAELSLEWAESLEGDDE